MNQENLESTLKYKQETREKKHLREFFLVIGGIFTGFVNGYFGAGGGMLAVPLLNYAARLNTKQAHATAIAVILPLSVVSSIVYVKSGALDLNIFPPVLVGTVLGGIVGALLLNFLNSKILTTIFYLTMLVAGIRLMF